MFFILFFKIPVYQSSADSVTGFGWTVHHVIRFVLLCLQNVYF